MMPLHPTWEDICLRLLLTVIAGAMLGFDREARGHAAGLRTTILVALAASVAMIQTNILLPLEGKDQGSFAVMDMMRLPLGILTGVGFLGGGAILKRGGSISGVTTAATLWIANRTCNTDALGHAKDHLAYPARAQGDACGGKGEWIAVPRSR
jgi:putative Mg2+ transporter-C (MgtC) family protein